MQVKCNSFLIKGENVFMTNKSGSNKENEVIVKNSSWATFTTLILILLMALWQYGGMPEYLVSLLLWMSIIILVVNFLTNIKLLNKVKRLLLYSIAQAVIIILGTIAIVFGLHFNLISWSMVGGLGILGIALLITWILSKITLVPTPSVFMFMLTFGVGAISLIIPSGIFPKLCGVFASTIFTSYKDKIKAVYSNIYKKYKKIKSSQTR